MDWQSRWSTAQKEGSLWPGDRCSGMGMLLRSQGLGRTPHRANQSPESFGQYNLTPLRQPVPPPFPIQQSTPGTALPALGPSPFLFCLLLSPARPPFHFIHVPLSRPAFPPFAPPPPCEGQCTLYRCAVPHLHSESC